MEGVYFSASATDFQAFFGLWGWESVQVPRQLRRVWEWTGARAGSNGRGQRELEYL